MARKRTPVITDANGAAGGPDILTLSKGATANATLGQTEFTGSGAITKSAVRGASNKQAIYVSQNGSVEPIDQTALATALAAGWKLVSAGYAKKRSFSLTGIAGAVKSIQLYCDVVTDVTIAWKQNKKSHDLVPATARTFLGQDTTAGTPAQVVTGANYFVFSTAYGIVPANTLIPRAALKASLRFAAETDTSSGVYTSYAKSEPA